MFMKQTSRQPLLLYWPGYLSEALVAAAAHKSMMLELLMQMSHAELRC